MTLRVPSSLSYGRRLIRSRSGQSLVEFSLLSLFLVGLLFGLIDFGRAISLRQTLINVSREAANLASRGTSLQDTLAAAVLSAKPFDIGKDGFVIISAVSKDASGNLTVSDQKSRGGNPHSSQVGVKGGTATLPNNQIPSPNQTLYVAEIFGKFTAVTPIGQILGNTVPTVLYDAAYF